ncbi:hypothetical protein OG268_22740 [Streptomyces uncialis]|nr:hypothetical protein OG268_22740 [Streptomyces uncialis]
MPRMTFGQGEPPWGSGGSHTPWNQGQPGNQGRPGHQGPGQGPDSGPTPDWAALAEASAARTRRKRLLMIGGSVLATLAIGAAVAVAIVSTDSGDKDDASPTALPTASDLPSDTTQPVPSFAATTPPPPPDPKDFISSAAKDKAPISPGSLFPGSQLTMGTEVYKKGATGSTTNCASVARGDLRQVLSGNGCTRMMRATYVKGKNAVTIGVALFDTEAKARKAKEQADKGNLLSLSGAGVSGFCNTVVCRTTANSYGRYAYFTVAGWTSGKNVTAKDSTVYRTGDDVAEFAFQQIIRRGEAQASAAAEQPL